MNYFQNCKTPDEAKKVYYKLSFKLHPDRPGGSTDKFQELTRQYEAFKNPKQNNGEQQTTNHEQQTTNHKQKSTVVSFVELLNDPQFNDIFLLIEKSFGYSKKQIIDIISNPGLLNMLGKELLIQFIQNKL